MRLVLKNFIPIVLGFLILFVFVGTTLASDTINLGNSQPFGIKPGDPGSSVGNILRNVILIFFIVGGLGVVIMFLWGALDWITSGGDKEKIGNARKKIVNAIIGLVLMALAFFALTVLGEIVNFNPLTNLTIPVLNAPRN